MQKRKRFTKRQKISPKFELSKDEVFDYKNIPLIQRFLNERGKIVPRRISGISAKNQRNLTTAIKQARFLALLSSGGVRK